MDTPPPLPTQIQTEGIAEGLVTGRGLVTVTTRRTGETYTSTWKSGARVMSGLASHHFIWMSPIRWWSDGSGSSSQAKAGSKARSHPHQLVLESRDPRGNKRSQMSSTTTEISNSKPTRNGVVTPSKLDKSGSPSRKAWGSQSGSTRDGRQPHRRQAQHELYPERLETALFPY